MPNDRGAMYSVQWMGCYVVYQYKFLHPIQQVQMCKDTVKQVHFTQIAAFNFANLVECPNLQKFNYLKTVPGKFYIDDKISFLFSWN